MALQSNSYEAYLIDRLTDPQYAAAYLTAVLEEYDPAVFTLALRYVVIGLGDGFNRVAEKSRLNRESLYRMLSRAGNPRLSSLNALLQSLGLEMHIVPRSSQRSLSDPSSIELREKDHDLSVTPTKRVP